MADLQNIEETLLRVSKRVRVNYLNMKQRIGFIISTNKMEINSIPQ